MNTRIIVFGFIVCLTLIISSFAQINTRTDTIRENGKTYTETYIFKITGYQEIKTLVYTNDCYNDNKTNTSICSQKHEYQISLNYSNPVIEKTLIQNIKINGNTINYDKKGCYVCNQGIVCISKQDGYSENRAEKYKCQIRSGESGYIINNQNKITQKRIDAGIEI